MASKREIVDDLRKIYGNTLSQRQVKHYLGMGDHQITEFLSDVPFMRTNRKKWFLAIDVARKITNLQQTAC